MMKTYLQPGDSIELGFVGHLGRSGKLIDVIPDAYAMIKYGGDDKDPRGVGDGVGWICREGLTYDIHLERETYRLWYDDEAAY